MRDLSIKDYVVTHGYSREEIMNSFKVSGQSGMMRSHKTNTLVLIANHEKAIYTDSWHGGIMHYTGMGRISNQNLYSAQNKTLLESNQNGVTVHLFEIFDNKVINKYIYSGIVKLIGKPFKSRQLDVNKEDRDVWVFPIRSQSKTDSNMFEIDTDMSDIIHKVMEEENIEQGEVILLETDKPNTLNIPKIRKKSIIAKKTDFINKSKRDMVIGLRGEELVVIYEKNQLKSLGLEGLSKQVKWVSRQSDDYGYDVLSFDEFGLEKYIEVKTTTIDNDQRPFDISANEVNTSNQYGDQYWIYRVYNVEGSQPKFYKTNGSISDEFNIIPSSYKAYIK